MITIARGSGVVPPIKVGGYALRRKRERTCPGPLGAPSTVGRVRAKGGGMPRLELVRGDVAYVDLAGATGGEKLGVRPCVVVQNNGGNRGSPLTIIAPITDEKQFKGYPQQVLIAGSDLGPNGKDSVIECGHL